MSLLRRKTLLVIVLIVLSVGRCGQRESTGNKQADALPALLDFPAPEPGVRTAPSSRPRLMVLGLDGGDWQILDEFVSRGRMPRLARLESQGASRVLKSFIPTLSPLVWTTIATGLDPPTHGILDFVEVEPSSGRLVPIAGASRLVPAIWNIASARGRTVGVVGWWATYPAETVNGFLISDRVAPFFGSPLPPSASTVFPPGVAVVVEKTEREVDSALDARALRLFLNVSEEEASQRHRAPGQGSNPVVDSRDVIRATAILGRAGLALYDRTRPDFFLLYIEGTDQIAHILAPYAPPPLEGVSPEDRQRFQQGVENYYAYVDRLIGAVADRAERDGADLILLSDHGFKWGAQRPPRSSTNWRTAGFWHRLDGVLLAWGRDVVADRSRKAASVFDVAPTLCAALGLPGDRRMKGRVLTDLFRPGVLQPEASVNWNEIVSVRRASASPVSAAQADETTRRLLALGYLTPSQAKTPEASGPATDSRSFGAWNNLGLFWKEQGKAEAARQAFLRAMEMNPKEYGPAFNLSEVDRSLGRDRESTEMLLRSGREGYPDFFAVVMLRVQEDVSSGHGRRARDLLERAAESAPAEHRFLPVLARIDLETKDCRAAEQVLRRYLENHPDDFDSWNVSASAALCLGDRRAAASRFRRSLAISPQQPRVTDMLRELSEPGQR